jgi:hypothetical protein
LYNCIYELFFFLGTPVSASSNTSLSGSISSGSRSLRNDLLVAADSVTNAMSTLVKELNSGIYKVIYLKLMILKLNFNKLTESPVNENAPNSMILKPLGYNKKDDKDDINKDFKSDSLSRSQYNKVRYFCN